MGINLTKEVKDSIGRTKKPSRKKSKKTPEIE
jgi:hypothetical protein